MADTSSSGHPLREGAVVSHYRILSPVGGGGMGMVYRALDLELDRVVALKFIASSVAWSDSSGSDVARQRFISEARTASALDHPHIGTIHGIDRTDDGQMFIVMGYYEGETLRARLARGPLPTEEVNRLFAEVLSGLAKAHAAGIVHRDIKPANVIVTADGMAKVIDFGLARFHDAIRVTATGRSVGTPGYMAPEQIEGEPVDARADVWALGALLYEMATGQAAFDGPNQAAIIHAVLAKHPERSLTGPAAAARPWAQILKRALDKNPERRYASAGGMLEAFSAWQSGGAARKPRRAQMWVVAVAAVAVLGAAYGWKRSNERSRVRTEDLPELGRLVGQQRFAQAAELFDRAQRVLGNDSTLVAMRGQIFATMLDSLVPAGARFEYREYSDTSGTWTPISLTVGDSARLPRGAKRWRVTAPGFDTLLVATASVPRVFDGSLDSAGSVPAGMVRMDQGRANAWIAGVDPIQGVPLDSYLIDRYEVSNHDFKVFVDSGGYRNRTYWKFPFTGGGTTLTWQAAMAKFVDQTGQPGPSTWELGSYPRGQDDYPVSGVSWYEAAAYAEFAHQSLPTVYHWVNAAGTFWPELIVPLSNFNGKGTAPRGSYSGMSIGSGLFDMAGNVREWQYNSDGQGRYALGGAWNDRTYMFTFAAVRDPLDRAPGDGFRLVVYRDGVEPAEAARDIPLERRDYSEERPVDDAAFRLILNQFSYDPTPLNAKTESVIDSAGWRHEVVSFDAAYGGDRVIAHLFFPTDRKPPFHTVVFWPGSGAIVARQFTESSEPFLVRSGYAYVVPIYWGTYERNAGITSTWPTQTHQYSEQVTKQIKDFRRTLDYVSTRRELDLTKLAYLGTSWGGRMGVLVNAIEPRIKVAILTDAGLAAGRALPEVDQINFAPRIRIPVLMLNGKFDAIEPYESAQLPLFRMLGSPADEKKHVVWPAAHGTYPRNEAEREMLAWLERFLGPVAR